MTTSAIAEKSPAHTYYLETKVDTTVALEFVCCIEANLFRPFYLVSNQLLLPPHRASLCGAEVRDSYVTLRLLATPEGQAMSPSVHICRKDETRVLNFASVVVDVV